MPDEKVPLYQEITATAASPDQMGDLRQPVIALVFLDSSDPSGGELRVPLTVSECLRVAEELTAAAHKVIATMGEPKEETPF